MTIQRRHLEPMAAAIAEARSDLQDYPERVAGLDLAAAYLTRALAKANPRFDRERFLAACRSTTDADAACISVGGQCARPKACPVHQD